MNPDEARQLLGVSSQATRAEIEQAFLDKQQQLQAQLAAGNPLTVRLRAQGDLSRLPVARDVLLRVASSPVPQPVSPQPSMPAGFQGMPRFVSLLNANHVAFLMSWIIAAVGMGFVAVSCLRAVSNRPTAQFRVLSVPWSEVHVDGKSVGPSGQSRPFEVPSGRRVLRLERDGKVIQKRVNFSDKRPTVIRVNFDRGDVYVSQD